MENCKPVSVPRSPRDEAREPADEEMVDRVTATMFRSCTMHLSWWSVSGNPPLRKRAPGSSQSELPRIVGSTNFNSSLNIWILQSNWIASVIQSFTTISSKMINCGECKCQSSLLSNRAPGSFQSELLKIVPSSTNFRLSLNIWIIQIILCA